MLIKIGNWAKRFVQEFTGLLDSYPNAAAAYSLRKLKKSYSGSAVRVRRSYDDAEADIGFSNNVLDETALLNHCVPSAVQAKYNNAMYFDGNNDAVVFSNPLIPRTGDFFVSFKFIVDPSFVSPSNVYAITQYTPGTSGRTLLGIDSSGNIFFSIDADSITGSNVIYGQEHTYLVTRTTNTYELFLDGVSQGTFFRSGPLDSTGTEFGREFDLSRFWQGTIYDININDEHTYNGYGNSSSDWEDQTGTQDGALSGSPALFSGQNYNGFVATWYDQSGNSRDFAQATAASQPTILKDGSINLENTKPAILHDGVNDDMEVAASTSTFKFLHDGTTSSVFMVTRVAFEPDPNDLYALLGTFNGSSSSTGALFRFDDRTANGNNEKYRFVVGNSKTGLLSIDNISSDGEFPAETQLLLSTIIDANDSTYANRDIMKINSGSIIANNSNTTLPSSADSDQNLTLGSNGSSNFIPANFQEIIIYDSDQTLDRGAIESNINSHWGIF